MPTVRGSTGLSISEGPPAYESIESFKKDESKTCKVMAFSPMGNYFAWANSTRVTVVLCETWQVVSTIDRAKIQGLEFSPQDTYLLTWEPFIGESKIKVILFYFFLIARLNFKIMYSFSSKP